jgi:NitT/TauT family transport system substrate-binding protein
MSPRNTAVSGHNSSRRVRTARLIPVALSTAMLAAGCGAAAAARPAASKTVTPITVAAVPGEGSAGIYIAQDDGLFAKAGLKVTITSVSSSDVVMPQMKAGSVQIVSGQYSSYVAAEVAGVASMRILSAGFSLGPRVQVVMIGPHSPISSAAQLRGTTIAVNAVNSETTDLLYTALTSYGIKANQVRVVAIPFPAMPAALAAGRIDAIYEIEPYATEASQQHGDEQLLDIDSGAAQSFPISGAAALTSWVTSHPQTAAAFAQAVEQGNRIAATNLGALERAFETTLHLPAQVTDVMALGTFPASIDSIELQRVSDLMQQYGQLSKPFSVASMVAK